MEAEAAMKKRNKPNWALLKTFKNSIQIGWIYETSVRYKKEHLGTHLFIWEKGGAINQESS